ncbi:MAG: hypothetical protein KAJ55_08210 [Anaerolineales bacterium]|nr:hypothetical protein [Anaerolineales bacterium]
MESVSRDIPKSLRVWFVIHFAIDIIFAIPMLLVPEFLMPLMGWSVVDPITSRLVGAALLGIGVESLLGRNANRDVFKAMLNLKIIWASGAVLGIGLGILAGGPPLAWIFLVIFAAFLGLWVYYRVKLR